MKEIYIGTINTNTQLFAHVQIALKFYIITNLSEFSQSIVM